MKKYLSNNEYLEDTWALAAQIRNSGWRPDILIALWRGGAPVGVAVHEFFKATGWHVQHIPLKCYSYSGIGQNEGSVEFTFGGQIFGMLRAGDKVLVVDDVFDTGKTAQAIKDKISRLGIDVDMRMAMVYWKPNKNRTAIKPDYYVRNLDDQWIVFPHELEGLTEAEIAEKDPKLARLVADAVRNK